MLYYIGKFGRQVDWLDVARRDRRDLRPRPFSQSWFLENYECQIRVPTLKFGLQRVVAGRGEKMRHLSKVGHSFLLIKVEAHTKNMQPAACVE